MCIDGVKNQLRRVSTEKVDYSHGMQYKYFLPFVRFTDE